MGIVWCEMKMGKLFLVLPSWYLVLGILLINKTGNVMVLSNNFMKKCKNFAFIDSQNLNLSIRELGWKLDFGRCVSTFKR